MCSIQINEEVLLTNVLGSPEIQKLERKKVSLEEISKCGIYLENNLPGYVNCETNIKRIERMVMLYGYDMDEQNCIDCTNLRIERERYNRSYPKRLANIIEDVVDCFFSKKLFGSDVEIVRLKKVVAEKGSMYV